MAFERCMSALGVNSRIVLGEANSIAKSKVLPWDSNHAWNEVEINGKWYNIDVTWIDFKKEKIDKMTEKSIIEKCVLSSDTQFIAHYKLEDDGISCEESLKGRFEIFEQVKKYKNVLEEYDNGKRNNMLQTKLAPNSTRDNNNADRHIKKETDDTIEL